MYTTRVHSASPTATVLVLSGSGLAQLRASQPLLLQKLLTTAFTQQQVSAYPQTLTLTSTLQPFSPSALTLQPLP